MSIIEQEIIEKFRSLDETSKRRVLLQMERETEIAATLPTPSTSLSPEAWLEWARTFGTYIHDKYGSLSPSSIDLLNEAREERLDDLMGGG